jgi:putative transposase
VRRGRFLARDEQNIAILPVLRCTAGLNKLEWPYYFMSKRRVSRPVQMTFEERWRYTLAGKRKKRPGPKPGRFPSVRHRARGVHKYWNPLHVTLRAVGGLPSFRLEVLYAAFERAFRTTRREGFRIVEFSVQDNHVHMIVEADDNDALARGMKSFSVRANRLFNAALGRGRGRVWGDRYHRRDLTSARQVRNALVYCINNYKKHHGVTHGRPRIDLCSSARWFRGWIAIREHDDGPRPTEEARTKLLSEIWHKHGFIHPGERPRAPN